MEIKRVETYDAGYPEKKKSLPAKAVAAGAVAAGIIIGGAMAGCGSMINGDMAYEGGIQYLSDTDVSAADISETDVSCTDVSGTDTEQCLIDGGIALAAD